MMLYKTISDLPSLIKKQLPLEAQEIYMQAFNQSYDEFRKAEPRSHASLTLNAKADAGAWAAVELKFHKQKTGCWVKKPER